MKERSVEHSNARTAPNLLDRLAVRDFCAGCFSGCVASFAGQPLDTVRIRVQTQSTALFAGPLDAARKTLRYEGVRGFFRGAIPPLIGMGPKNAIGFATHGATLRLLDSWHSCEDQAHTRGNNADNIANQQRHSSNLDDVMIAGAIAGLAQCAVIVPTDRVKIQLQVQGRGMALSNGMQSSVSAAAGKSQAARDVSLGAALRCATKLWRADGWGKGLYRGWWATVARQAPATAVYFSSFESLKRKLGPGTPATAVAGGMAGCAAYLCTYPLDVLRSAIMARPAGTPDADTRMLAVARQLRQEHGGSARWLARGLMPTLARGFVINAVNFTLYEWAVNFIIITSE